MIADIVRDTKHSSVLSDVGAWIAAWLAIWLAARLLPGWQSLPGTGLIVFPGLLGLWVVCLAATGSYQPATSLRAKLRLLSGSILFAALSIILGGRGARSHDGLMLSTIAAVALGLAFLFRTWLPWRIRRWVRGRPLETVLVLGEKTVTDAVEAELRRCLHLTTVQAGFPHGPNLEERMGSLIAESQAKEVLCMDPAASPDAIRSLREICRQYHAGCQFVPLQECYDKSGWGTLLPGGIPVIGTNNSSVNGFNLLYKTALDLCLGSILLLFAAPVMVLIAIGIRLTSSGPAVLAQERVGHLGNHFKMYKFRTMYENAKDERHREYVQNWMKNQAHTESNGQKIFKITNDDRITPFGHLLRRYSLDELPQILNVLKLEMSIVGPRPAMPYELEGYSPWHLERLDGPPGLTGPWQVNGRNHLSFDEMVQLDVNYLRNWSPLRDLVLIARTVPAMLLGKGH
jgi:exopolysaccharide biosynthesis polyprenyl glycosylphosphotransferase